MVKQNSTAQNERLNLYADIVSMKNMRLLGGNANTQT